jgi:hypothetical protein
VVDVEFTALEGAFLCGGVELDAVREELAFDETLSEVEALPDLV